jgi:Putative peptidoglycan binding domain
MVGLIAEAFQIGFLDASVIPPSVFLPPGCAMSKVVGFVLIIAGLGVGVFAIAPSVDIGRQSEAVRSLISSPVVNGVKLKHEVALVPRLPVAEASRDSSPFVATLEPYIGKPRIPQQRLAIPKDREALTRELQKELRRVGCYEGDISGTWSQSTRRAMKTFIERMNGRLPIEEPDAVLYSLVKSQDQRVCGVGCARGEAPSADGRCIPSVLLAHVKDKEPALASGGASVSTTHQSTEPSLEGHMGLAGPPRPTLETTMHPRRDRATRTMGAGQPHIGQGAQRWSTSIFSSRFNN